MQDPERRPLREMIDDTPLSILCYICKSALPKYTCPRCRRRTCSLPCCQQHKKWDQCNGKRDQTAYVKASQLATPSGIDHDYNFITGIERRFDRADRELEQCGINAEDDDGRPGGKVFRKALAKMNVFVQNAPKGLSRQKNNRTFWSKRMNGIVWTVEFVHPDGSKQLVNIPQNHTINRKYRAICAQRDSTTQNGSQRKLQTSSRKENEDANPPTKKQRLDTNSSGTTTEHNSEAPPTKDTQTTATISETGQDTINPDATQPTPAYLPEETDPTIHFYLHKPLTIGSERVLIPLDASTTLRHSLNSRVVLEFPTIHVMHHPPNQLPDGFITESTYLDKRKALIREVDEELGGAGVWPADNASSTTESTAQASQHEQVNVTDSKIMDSLRKDLEAARSVVGGGGP